MDNVKTCPLTLEIRRGVAIFKEPCRGNLWEMCKGTPDAHYQCSRCGMTWSDGKEPEGG